MLIEIKNTVAYWGARESGHSKFNFVHLKFEVPLRLPRSEIE